MNEKKLSDQDKKYIDTRLEIRSRETLSRQPRKNMPNSIESSPTIEQIFALLDNLPDEEVPSNLVNKTVKYVESHAHQDAQLDTKADSQRRVQRPPLHG